MGNWPAGAVSNEYVASPDAGQGGAESVGAGRGPERAAARHSKPKQVVKQAGGKKLENNELHAD